MVEAEQNISIERRVALRLCLLGGGIWGEKILRVLVAMQLHVTVVEPNPERHQPLMHLGAARVLTSLPPEGAFAGFVVATPTFTHAAVVKQLSPFGVPIFLEKPLTINLKEARELATYDTSQLFLMHVWRYHAGIQALGNMARTQVLGKVYGLRTTRANWTSPRRDTDSLWNLVPHDLTIALEVLGYIPEPQHAMVERHGAMIRGLVATLGKDPYLIVEASNRYERKIREVRLHCELGVAVLTDEKVNYVTVYHGDAHSSPNAVREERVYFDATPPLNVELTEFVAYVRGGPPPRCSFVEGLAVVETLDRLQRMS